MNENPIPRRTLLTRFLTVVGIAVPVSFLSGKLFAQAPQPATPVPCGTGAVPTAASAVQTPSNASDRHLGQNKSNPAPPQVIMRDLGQNKPIPATPERRK